jgi:glycosyl transferase family 25
VLPAYVIHAKSLPERAVHIRRELEKAGISFEWVLQHDASEITPDLEKIYFQPGADLTPGQKSCALKHIAAMQLIRDRGQDLALIFEDDAFLVRDFRSKLEAVLREAEQWPRPRIVHLGAATNFYTPASELRPGRLIYEGNRVRNMEAYALGTVEAKARLDWLERNPMNEPIDIALNRGDPEMGIPFLWPEPPLAEQGSLNGAFKSSLDRKERGRLRLCLQFAVQKFRRKRLKRWLNMQ